MSYGNICKNCRHYEEHHIDSGIHKGKCVFEWKGCNCECEKFELLVDENVELKTVERREQKPMLNSKVRHFALLAAAMGGEHLHRERGFRPYLHESPIPKPTSGLQNKIINEQRAKHEAKEARRAARFR